MGIHVNTLSRGVIWPCFSCVVFSQAAVWRYTVEANQDYKHGDKLRCFCGSPDVRL